MEVEGIAELPAESNPLTESLLIHAIKGALSGDNQRLITSKQQLEQWQSKSGYYLMLQSIFEDKRLPSDVRLQSIIQIKNGVEKYWRRGSKAMILDQEKEQLRSRILNSAVQESDRKLAVLVALTVAKIARFDFPAKWPNVISILVDNIRQYTSPELEGIYPYQLRRSLLLLLNVTKEVTQNRVGAGRVKLKSSASELLLLLGSIYFSCFQSGLIQEAFQEPSLLPMLEAVLEQSLLAIKTIRRLILLLDNMRSNDTVSEFWHRSLPEFQSILQFAITHDLAVDQQAPVILLLHKNLGQVAKLHVHVAKNYPTDFALLQNEKFEIIRMHWHLMSLLGQQYASAAGYPAIVQVTPSIQDFDESRKALVDKLGLQALLLLRACVKMIAMPGRGLRYRTPEEKQQDADAVEKMKEKVFTDNAVLELVNHIVMELLLFQPSDLQEWEEDPDEWEKREELGTEDFDFASRPCAEKLLLDLALYFREITLPEVLKMVERVTAPGYSSILQKESVYCAVGLAAPFLDKSLDFKSLLLSHLVPEVQIQNPQYKILRRRIAILVGQWSTIEDSKGCRPIYFQVFQFLLNKDDPLNDQVVRVSAGRQLSRAVDAFECKPEDFMPYAETILTQLMILVEEVELSETKMALLSTISIIVQRLEHHITPYADRIVSILPQLWDQSGDEHLMKQTILALLSRLFLSMKEGGAKYHSLVLPLIRETVMPSSQLGESLLEDTLDLWCTVIQQTPTPSSESDLNPDLLSLIEYLLPLLDHDTENLEKAIEILQAYTLLAPNVILSRQVYPTILTQFKSKLGTMHHGHSGYVTDAVEYGWRAAVALQGTVAAQELVFQMLSTGFFDGLIDGLKEAWEAHQTTGPKAIHTKIQGIIETDYFAIISRIAYESPEVFFEALRKSESASRPPENKKDFTDTMDPPVQWLFEEWFSHAEDFGDPYRRKLMTMAFTKTLDLPQPILLGHMQSLLSLWTNVIVELVDETGDQNVDSLVWGPKPVEENRELQSPEEVRRSTLARLDPVHTVNLIELVRNGLRNFIQRYGGEQKFRDEVLVNIDKDVINGFGALGIL